MAFLALHGALIDDLVEAVTGIPKVRICVLIYFLIHAASIWDMD
jgi:hypothetical protein